MTPSLETAGPVLTGNRHIAEGDLVHGTREITGSGLVIVEGRVFIVIDPLFVSVDTTVVGSFFPIDHGILHRNIMHHKASYDTKHTSRMGTRSGISSHILRCYPDAVDLNTIHQHIAIAHDIGPVGSRIGGHTAGIVGLRSHLNILYLNVLDAAVVIAKTVVGIGSTSRIICSWLYDILRIPAIRIHILTILQIPFWLCQIVLAADDFMTVLRMIRAYDITSQSACTDLTGDCIAVFHCLPFIEGQILGCLDIHQVTAEITRQSADPGAVRLYIEVGKLHIREASHTLTDGSEPVTSS